MRTITLLDTATTSTNLGDQIIMEAVRHEVSALCPDAFQYSVVTHEWMGRRSRRLIRRADAAIVGGSNLLSSRMWFRPLWKVSPLEAIRPGQIILMGAGWYQDQAPADLYSRLLLRRLLSARGLHSVRDSQAERMLTVAGIRNVVNTGCPTLWCLTPVRCARIPHARGRSVVTTLNTYIPDPTLDRFLLEQLHKRYERVFFWTQTAEDRAYADQFEGTLIHLDPSLHALDRLLEHEADLDYVGNRLHAGIRAMQKGRRAVIVEIDNRARMMSEDVSLVTVARDDLERLVHLIEQPFESRVHLPTDAIDRWREQFRNVSAAG